jgi:hypothetical protein
VLVGVMVWKVFMTMGKLLRGLILSVLGLFGLIAVMVLMYRDNYSYLPPLTDHEMGRIIMAVSATVILLLGIYLLVMHFVKTKQD